VLVLTRKVGDVIAIGDNIKIVVMAIKGKQVRLGVQADRNTIVHREEIYQKIQQETQAALQNDMTTARAAGELLRGSADSLDAHGGLSRPKKTSAGFVVRRAVAAPTAEDDDEA
jgi:carbon storage regulator